MIERGTKTLHVPQRDERIFPADHIAVIGTDEQLEKFSQLIVQAQQQAPPDQVENIGLMQIILGKNASLTGKSIRESGIRNMGKGLVVGVERKGNRYLNPESSFVFEADDTVWIAGNKEQIQQFLG